jgi:anaerobic ribonucleoside-triphosphate reductase activating protein
MMRLAISRIHFPVTTLGPGRRVGIWFQGCSIRCPGCISVDTWRAVPGEVTAPALVESIEPWLSECDGVTISGGEPFDQLPGLESLLKELRRRFDTNVLVYSGYSYETVLESQMAWGGLIDALVSDPFVENIEQTKALRGSDNQRLQCLTPLGVALFSSYEHLAVEEDKHLDIMFDENGTVWMAGIPTRGDMAKLKALLIEEGHSAQTTEAPISLCKTQN